MNVLKKISEWKSNDELPDISGIYLTYSKENGLHQWGFNSDKGVWGDGIYTPGKRFNWLNVRIDVESGFNKET